MAPHSGVAVYLPYLITTGEANKQLVLIFWFIEDYNTGYTVQESREMGHKAAR